MWNTGFKNNIKNDLSQGKYQDIEQFWLKGDLLEYGLITQDKFRFYVHWLDFKARVLLFQEKKKSLLPKYGLVSTPIHRKSNFSL